MGIDNLSPDGRERVEWVLCWISRMTKKYGGTVIDKETGKTWDWGQALCRECYGIDWNNIIAEQGIETPTWEDIARAKRWEEGEVPKWFGNKPKTN